MWNRISSETKEPLYSAAPGEDPDEHDTLVIEEDVETPQQWQPLAKLKGSGQWEYQGFEYWAREEKEQWRRGKLRSKWGIGQVSMRLPIQDGIQLTALAYGFLPFLIPAVWAFWAIESRISDGHARFFPCFGLGISLVFALVNETITKQVCRLALGSELTHRPPEAVCRHSGMPSGHVLNAYTLMVWLLLEAVCDTQIYLEWLLIIFVAMGPVPWARVYNRDHTVPQVVVSAIIAVPMGAMAFATRKIYFHFHEEPWSYLHASVGINNPWQ